MAKTTVEFWKEESVFFKQISQVLQTEGYVKVSGDYEAGADGLKAYHLAHSNKCNLDTNTNSEGVHTLRSLAFAV